MGSWASITAHARWTLRLLAVPDRLKVGSRKPELGTNRPTSWPAKDPLGRRLQDPRGLKQISNPQAGFSETTDVRKDSGGHWQILSISDLQSFKSFFVLSPFLLFLRAAWGQDDSPSPAWLLASFCSSNLPPPRKPFREGGDGVKPCILANSMCKACVTRRSTARPVRLEHKVSGRGRGQPCRAF
eukprot:bmy_04540T0